MPASKRVFHGEPRSRISKSQTLRAMLLRMLKFSLLMYLLASSLLGCANPLEVVGVSPTTPTPTLPPASIADVPLDTWVTTAPGIELRRETWTSAGNNQDTVVISRFDTKKVHLSIGYNADKPQSLGQWASQTQAKAIINGGYFDQNNHPTALLISDSAIYGASYQGFGGMLYVDKQGKIGLRSLRTTPYRTNEQLQQATQSSPMLMMDGKRTEFSANAASQRRSIVAIDKQGRLLFIASPSQAFSLDEMADLLAASNLGLQNALNLDGGASTGLFVDGETDVMVGAYTTLPIVIIVK
jgi:uncharacterized protein YigE (DUF2233 family)